MELAGKTALVTGASRGVGKAIASALVEAGVTVLGTSRNRNPEGWPEQVKHAVLDASSREDIDRFWKENGLDREVPDIVINNAGSGVFGQFDVISFEDWVDQIELMLLGAMRLSRLALESWSEEKPGFLVNIGSLSVEYPIPYLSAYNAAKAGLAAFSESLRLEANPATVRVLELRLGDLNTEFNEAMRGGPTDSRQQRAWRSMERRAKKSPSPEKMAAKLLKALRKDKTGVVRGGSFFQTVIASLFGKIVSQGLRRAVNSRYYNLGRDP